MTEKQEHYSPEIIKLLEDKEFNSLFSIFEKNNFSPTELLIFYKRNKKKVLEPPIFWTSQLPLFHLESIFESNLKVTFMENYFANDKNCNHELNKHLYVIAKDDFIKYIKLWEVFNHSSFYDSLNRLSETDTELERTVKEFDIIIKAQNQIAEEVKKDENYLLEFSFGEIGLAFTLYYYAFKQQEQIKGNKSLQTQIEMTLVNELSYIISLFKGKQNMAFQFVNNEELQDQFQRNEAPHKFFGKKGLIVPPEPKFQRLFDLIDRLINRNNRRNQIELYLNGFADFLSIILNPAHLQTNRSYRIFKLNNTKSNPEELYFSSLRFDFSKPQNLSKTDITSSIETLKFYDIPETVKHKETMIEVKKAFQLLKHFSVYKGPVERTIFSNGSFIIMNQADDLFKELFGSNESITLFDYDTLNKGISKYFKWTEEETKSILSFLTLDITLKSFPESWVSSPFLKCNNQVLWLGSFLKDRRWDTIILNKLKSGSEYKDLKVTTKNGNPVPVKEMIPKNFEKRIEDLFKSKSFNTVCSESFKSSNGETGDFDVLAYKNNHLFVCEAKTSLKDDSFNHAAKNEAITLNNAAEQLEKAVFNVKEDWINIKEKLRIDKDISIESVKITPLIVTNHFEGDLKLYKNSIIKTSLLELDVILSNKKKEFLETYLLFTRISNSLNPNLKDTISSISNWDLWEGKKEMDVEDIIRNIDQNTIWKEIETIWKFEDESYMIDY